MIPKSGIRFSDQIMLRQEPKEYATRSHPHPSPSPTGSRAAELPPSSAALFFAGLREALRYAAFAMMRPTQSRKATAAPS